MVQIMVTKRDGTKEPFQVEKINKWWMWATEQHKIPVGQGVEAVQRAVQSLSKETTTEKIQRALINELIALGEWNTILMAGSLEASLVTKKVHGNTIPTVKDHFTKLYETGYIVKFSLDDDEWEELQSVIKHERDFYMPQFAIRYIMDSYALGNVVTGERVETPQFVYMRLAVDVGSTYPKGRRMEVIKELYELYSLKVLSAPTPVFTHLGTHDSGVSSCCLFAAGDDRRSLAAANMIAYVMTYMSAGLGYHQNVRTVGDAVRGGKIKHQGDIFYLKSIASNAAANKQSKRGGAVNAFLSAYSKEIEFILAGREPTASPGKAINGIDISLVITRDFIKRANASKEGLCFTEYSHPEMFKEMYSGDPASFEAMMEKALAENTDPKKVIKPREVLGTLGRVTVSTGRNFAFLVDNVNHHTPFKERILGSNLCVAPETVILTKAGFLPIVSLENQTVEVWNGEEWSETVVRKTGKDQKLLKVTTDSGFTLECTPEHKWYVAQGYSGKFVEKRTHELKEGDSLIKFDLPVVDGDKELELAYVNGFYTGDGCDTPEGQRIYLYHEKQGLKHLFKGISNWTEQPAFNRVYGHYKNLQEKFFVPLQGYTVKSRLNWLAGYLDADGCIYRNQGNQQITASSTNYKFLQEVQLLLQTLGVHSKIRTLREAGEYKMPANDGSGDTALFPCNTSYRLLVDSVSTQKLLGLGLGAALHRLELVEHTPQRSAARFVKISKVEDLGRISDTYCFTEEKRHMGVFNGILTGQCMEIVNPTVPYENIQDLWREDDDVVGEVSMCNLGAVNHNLVADDPELHKRACKAALIMIDHCIQHGYYELPHIGYTAKKRMNAAVGVMNTATYMARNKLKFDSVEGIKHVSEFAERHMYYLIESSLELGIEKGNAPWIHKTKWAGYTNSEGVYVPAWMPIDTQNKRLAKELGLEPKMPWEILRARVAANGGIRNSVLAAIMPGESSSKALGAANAIYPVRDVTLNKTDSTTAIDWCAEGAGNPDYEYQLAYTMSTVDTIKYYAAWQMWLDGAISADFWLPFERGRNHIDINDIIEKYATMYAYGLKTHYYTVPKTQKSNADKEADTKLLLEKAKAFLTSFPVTADGKPAEYIHDGWASSQQQESEEDDRVYTGESNCSNGACTL